MRRPANNHRVNGKWRISPGSAGSYAFAAFCVVVASLLRWGLELVTDAVSPFPSYFPAVLFATLIGGAGAGTFAAIAGGIIAWWAFIPPHYAFFPLEAGQETNLLAYLVASLLIVWAAARYRKVTKSLEDAERFRELAVEELAHRLKNKLATIQSIISYQLREHARIRDDILGRLGALSATDDLIMAAQGRGAGIHDILATELGPYEVSRISMEGPDIFLAPKPALTMALLFHELATNAAKYGALSSSAGRLSICWSVADRKLRLEWRETGGPIIAPPAHRGFGMRLLSRALDQFGGSVEMVFESTGLVCKMSATLPDIAPSIVPDQKRARPEALLAD